MIPTFTLSSRLLTQRDVLDPSGHACVAGAHVNQHSDNLAKSAKASERKAYTPCPSATAKTVSPVRSQPDEHPSPP